MDSLRITNAWESLTPMEWMEIPKLAVLSGFNGVGKTQLLSLLAQAVNDDLGFGPMKRVVDLSPKPRRVGYLGAHWSPESAKCTLRLLDAVDHVEKELDGYKRVGLDNLEWWLSQLPYKYGKAAVTVELIMKQLDAVGLRRPGVRKREIYGVIDPYLFVSHNPETPLVGLAELLFCYRNVEAYKSSTLDEPPWVYVNELLESLEMRFRVEAPDMAGHDYELLCIPGNGGTRLAPKELSSGEQAALALVATFVTTVHLGRTHRVRPNAPDLLLLDEPDAHLHPSLVKAYLSHLRTLVEKHGTQVIMVTHRPDTIALSPDEALFEMKRHIQGTSIEKVCSRSALIARLAADAIAVLPSVRVVLCEDEDDRVFHQAMYQRAVELELISETPQLVFMPVNARGGGGWKEVEARRKFMSDKGVGALYLGLVDRDDGERVLPAGIFRSKGRPALENYLADPIAVYASIVNEPEVDEKLAMSLRGGIDLAHLHEIRTLSPNDLQRLVDLVLSVMEPGVPTHLSIDDFSERAEVRLYGSSGPVDLRYPVWLLAAAPKPLIGALNAKLHKTIQSIYLRGPARTGLVPADLVDVYREIVTSRL